MGDETRMFQDPAFRRLLRIRRWWRWGLSGTVIGVYLAYGVAGVYFPEFYARPFPGSALPWGMVMGLLIIALSIVLSMVYVRLVNHFEAEHEQNREPGK